MNKRSIGITVAGVLIATAAILGSGCASGQDAPAPPAEVRGQAPHGALLSRLRAILRLLGVSGPDDFEAWQRHAEMERATYGPSGDVGE